MGSEMRKWSVRFLAVMGALLLLAFTIDQVWTSALAHELEQRIEELRAAGEPVDFESLAGPPMPDDQNAAPLLIRAYKWYEETDECWIEKSSDDWGDERLGFEPAVIWENVPVDEWSDQDWRATRGYVKECAPFFELVEEAAARPHCRFDDPHGWPRIFVAAPLGRAFRARALMEAGEPGGSSKAARTAKVLMSTGKWRGPRIALTYLVGLVVEEGGVDIVREVAGRPGFDAHAARTILDGQLRRLAESAELADALRGERAYFLEVLREPMEGSLEGSFGVDWPTRRHAHKDASRYLDMMGSTIRAVLDGDQETVDRVLERARASDSAFPLTRLTPILIGNLQFSSTRHEAVGNLARVALAVLEAKQETGVWPPDLSLIHARFEEGMPLDPWTNAPFVSERTKTGLRLAASPPDPEGRLYPMESDLEDHILVWNLRDG
ncbi:MAG: hypothetical protein O7C98_01205 [Planctomycetota bacterium]|nr:hypothetical protein [Planctomycetota bacterium]